MILFLHNKRSLQQHSWHLARVQLITNITGAQEIEDNAHSKSITPSETEEMERSQDGDANLEHSENDGEVDKGDNALPFMETSSIGNNELFGSDPLLLCGTIVSTFRFCWLY